jgi:hypothetical protein
MKIKPLTNIEDVLKYDSPELLPFTPVMLCDRSLWQKFAAALKGSR